MRGVKLEDGRHVMALTTDDIRRNIAKERNINVDNIEYDGGTYYLCVRGGIGDVSVTLMRYPLAKYVKSP
ncbi:hypothetical protein [Paenibacillus tundrae]|uniref:Uncharacterized protein n=1 Tax=Paenibacillus tundrae TaxID=528187 RepID=A0ABT9W6A0_9BACL|nr:hypothetical protein [Paenibacillus tundrae]MDQ0168760.1 hypothetical protein [Paenibacillus tundrae]